MSIKTLKHASSLDELFISPVEKDSKTDKNVVKFINETELPHVLVDLLCLYGIMHTMNLGEINKYNFKYEVIVLWTRVLRV